jgi:hypothetical protein
VGGGSLRVFVNPLGFPQSSRDPHKTLSDPHRTLSVPAKPFRILTKPLAIVTNSFGILCSSKVHRDPHEARLGSYKAPSEFCGAILISVSMQSHPCIYEVAQDSYEPLAVLNKSVGSS